MDSKGIKRNFIRWDSEVSYQHLQLLFRKHRNYICQGLPKLVKTHQIGINDNDNIGCH